jgi:protein ATS1
MALYALGSNGAGQLGIGHVEDVALPSPTLFAPGITEPSGVPLQVAAGGNHTVIRYSSGQIYIAGASQEHMIKGDKLEGKAFAPLHFGDTTTRGKLCSATWQASIVVTTKDVIYTFGSGTRGELGREEDDGRALDMSWLPEGTTIEHIASGLQHTVVVLSNGDVYGWGYGRKGQLGEPPGIIPNPRKIEGLDFAVVRAACGREFTYLVGSSDEGRHVILGSDKWGLKSNAPANIHGWKDIGASWGSIYVLDLSGHITSWGRNDHGQLVPNGLPYVEDIAVGSEHVLALTKHAKVLTWGWGEHGNCGPVMDADGDVKHGWSEIDSGTRTVSETIVGIGAGCATSWLWTAPSACNANT